MKYFILFLMPIFSQAADPRPDMHLLAKEISAMQRFMLSEAAFVNADNESAIRNSLNNIERHLEHLDKGAINDPAMRVNLSMTQQHVRDARRTFDSGGKTFARFMLQSTMQMCIACHTRVKTADFSWPDQGMENASLEEKGDFYFATRQFDKGRKAYEEIVAKYPSLEISRSALRKAVLALAIYYARVKESPEEGGEYFRKLSKREDFPMYMQDEMRAWSNEFLEWAGEAKKPDPKKSTESQLVARAKKLLKHDDFSIVSGMDGKFHVRRLRASALLQRALELQGGPSPAKGEAIYYLGQIYRRISSGFFFRFGEMYLKACITEYPKSARGRACYNALEEEIVEGYSGSSGTHIPRDEEGELIRLKRIAY